MNPNEADNTAQSTVVIGLGAHRQEKAASILFDAPSDSDDDVNNALKYSVSSTSIHQLPLVPNTRSTQTLKVPEIKPILLDLNHLQSEEDCPDGCKVDVYVTVRHRPGCPHQYHQDFSIGVKRFDYIGKGTYRYQMDDEDELLKSHSEFKRRCELFSTRCDKLLQELTNSKVMRLENEDDARELRELRHMRAHHSGYIGLTQSQSQKVLSHRTFFQVIDKFCYHDEPLKRNFSEKFTKSEIDLYQWDYINQ